MARRNKGEERELAVARMRQLLHLASAGQRTGEAADRVRRYVRLARRLGMRYQVSVPRELRRRICRSCDAYLVPGSSARVRVTSGRLSITCLACGAIQRYPFKKRPGGAAR